MVSKDEKLKAVNSTIEKWEKVEIETNKLGALIGSICGLCQLHSCDSCPADELCKDNQEDMEKIQKLLWNRLRLNLKGLRDIKTVIEAS